MHRNLITRLGVAAGVVAVLIGVVFVLILRQVGSLRSDGAATDAVLRAELLVVVGLMGSAVAILVLAAYLVRYIIVPVRAVTAAAEELASGDLSVRVGEDGDAEPVALARAFNDLAEHLQSEHEQTRAALEALAAEKQRIERFHRAGERLAAARDLAELATIALAEMTISAAAEQGAIWVVAPEDQHELLLEAVIGAAGDDVPQSLREDDSPAGRALAGLEHVAVDAPPRAELHVPLSAGGRVLGLASLAREDARPFSASECDALLRLAEQVSVALSNAISYRSARRVARVNRAVLDATPDPVGLFGLDGTLIAHNAAMAEVWSLHPDLDATGAGEDADQRVPVTFGDHSYSRFTGPVRDETGERMGRLVVLRDVTSERESERLKDEFFALVSHELRTPLTSIIGYLELVRDDEEQLAPDTRRFLEVVDRNAKRLLRLVGDMLFVAQVEAGRLTLERAPLDLGQVVADSVEAASPAAARGGVGLRLEAEAVGPIDGDRDRVGQLFDNLISNALKFTAEGGEVVVTVGPDGEGSVLVAVRDDGIGIPDTEQQHLFDRFFRSSAAATRAVPGAGLGLAIVKTIVEAHDGEVALQSVEGIGTTVSVRLPLTVPVPA